MRPKTRGLASAGLLACLVAGCSFLRPRPDPSRFFVLVSMAPASAAPAAATRGDSFGVGPVHLPDYLKRPTIVTRTSPTQIEPSDVDRWGEPIDRAVPRVLQEDLRRLLDTDRVVLFPWYASERPTYQAVIDILRFERDAENRAHLVARWEVRDSASGKRLHTGETRVTRDAAAPDAAAAIAAESAALGELSGQIAAAFEAAAVERRSE